MAALLFQYLAQKKVLNQVARVVVKERTSSGSSTGTGAKTKFIKCVTALSGSLSRAEVDNCWNQVFGSDSVTGLALGTSTGSSSSSGHF